MSEHFVADPSSATGVLIVGQAIYISDPEALRQAAELAAAVGLQAFAPEGAADATKVQNATLFGVALADADAEEEMQGRPGWEYGMGVTVAGATIEDALTKHGAKDVWAKLQAAGHVEGEFGLYIAARGPLAAAWARGSFGEIQVCVEGSPIALLEGVEGDCEIAAQFD